MLFTMILNILIFGASLVSAVPQVEVSIVISATISISSDFITLHATPAALASVETASLGYTNSSTSPSSTPTGLSGVQCDLSNPSKWIPNDIPTDDPIKTSKTSYYRVDPKFLGANSGGNPTLHLNGHFPTIANGGPDARANSYSDGFKACSELCDASSTCNSFSVFTVLEDDVNNCLPTWICRLSPDVFDIPNDNYKRQYSDNDFYAAAWTKLYHYTGTGCEQYSPQLPPNVLPSDVPVQSPYKNATASNLSPFYPVSQTDIKISDHVWRILPGNTVATSPGPNFDSYEAGVALCSDYCEQTDRCLSFSVLNTLEPDVNQCAPSWVCRTATNPFSAAVFSGSDNQFAAAWTKHWAQLPDGTCYLAPNTNSTMPTDVPFNSSYNTTIGYTFSYIDSLSLKNPSGGYFINENYTRQIDGSAGLRANSYTDAFAACSKACETELCQSFNIVTSVESDMNNCQPTWICRTSKNTFNKADYTWGNFQYSVAWTMEAIPDSPDSSCIYSFNHAYHDPCLWDSYSMPSWILYATSFYNVSTEPFTPQFYKNFLAQVCQNTNSECDFYNTEEPCSAGDNPKSHDIIDVRCFLLELSIQKFHAYYKIYWQTYAFIASIVGVQSESVYEKLIVDQNKFGGDVDGYTTAMQPFEWVKSDTFNLFFSLSALIPGIGEGAAVTGEVLKEMYEIFEWAGTFNDPGNYQISGINSQQDRDIFNQLWFDDLLNIQNHFRDIVNSTVDDYPGRDQVFLLNAAFQKGRWLDIDMGAVVANLYNDTAEAFLVKRMRSIAMEASRVFIFRADKGSARACDADRNARASADHPWPGVYCDGSILYVPMQFQCPNAAVSCDNSFNYNSGTGPQNTPPNENQVFHWSNGWHLDRDTMIDIYRSSYECQQYMFGPNMPLNQTNLYPSPQLTLANATSVCAANLPVCVLNDPGLLAQSAKDHWGGAPVNDWLRQEIACSHYLTGSKWMNVF